MSDEKKQKNNIAESSEKGRLNSVIQEVRFPSDINADNGIWIDDRASYYIDQLKSKYGEAKEQLGSLPENSAKALVKIFKDWPRQIGDARERILDLWEEAEISRKETGEISEKQLHEINSLIIKLNEIFDKIERQGIVSTGKKIEPEKSESFEEYYQKEMESAVASGREDINRCRETFEMIDSSLNKKHYDANFLDQLNSFSKKIDIVEKWLNGFEKAINVEKSKYGVFSKNESEKLSEKEIDDVIANLKKLQDDTEKNIKALSRRAESVRKDVEKSMTERAELAKRIDVLIKRITDRALVGFFAGKDSAKTAKFMLERLNQMKDKPLDKDMVELAEKEAEETVFSPEAKSDEKKEKMDLQYTWKRRVLDEQKNLERMISEFEDIQHRLRKSSKHTQDQLEEVGRSLALARGRSDLLIESLDSINSAKEQPLDEIKFQLDAYKDAYFKAENLFKKFEPELARSALVSLQPKIMTALSDLNKDFISSGQRTTIEGWKILFEKGGDYNLEEVNKFAEKLDDIVSEIDAKRKDYLEKIEAGLKEEALEREFMHRGDELSKEKKSFIAPKQARREEDRLIKKPKVTKVDLLEGIKEMFEEQGIIDLSPESILSALTSAEVNSLIENVKNDVIAKGDNNRDSFERSLRSVLNERLLQAIDPNKREKICQAVSAQAYSLMKGAVEAEAQNELARLQSGKAEKFMKAGKVGAKLAVNIGFAAGVGIGAGLIIGSGGAAAAIAGASIGVARLANKAIAKSEIFQVAKAKAASLWERTAGKLFNKEKPQFDTDKIIGETATKVIRPEVIAAILSNQLRENSSQELLLAVNAYGETKSEAMRKPSLDSVDKFESSLDEVSREFYKKSYNYLAMYYKENNLPEETLSRMALQMTLNLSLYQRNEVKLAEALEHPTVKSQLPDEKHWLVNKMERLMKFRSEGVGSVVFGGALAYAVSETSSAGRIASGAIAGAGLGLMIERKTRRSDREKLLSVIQGIIDETEKKIFGRDAIILPSELNKAKKDAAYIRAQIDAGVFEGNDLLRNRAENFIIQVNREMSKTYERPRFSVDDLLRDVSKQSKILEKETAKTIKKTLDIFKTKDRQLAFMAVGALVGGAAGYLGARLAEYLKAPEPQSIQLTEAPFEVAPRPFAYAPIENIIPPKTQLEPILPQTPLEPLAPVAPSESLGMTGEEEISMAPEIVHATKPEAGKSIPNIIERAPRGLRTEEIEEAVSKTGEPLEVSEVYRASIYEWPKKEPLFFTREEEMRINELAARGDIEELNKAITEAKSHGRIYEDLKTGKQYHADELSFIKDSKLYTSEEVFGKNEPAPGAKIKEAPENPYNETDEDIAGKDADKLENLREESGRKIINPYDEPVEPYVRPENMPESDFDRIMADIPKNKITEDQYHTMIDIYNKSNDSSLASKYIHYVEEGKLKQAEAIEKLIIDTPEPSPQIQEEIAPEPKEIQSSAEPIVEEIVLAPEANQPEAVQAIPQNIETENIVEPSVETAEPTDEDIRKRAEEVIAQAKEREAERIEAEGVEAEEEEIEADDEVRAQAESYAREAELRLVEQLKSAKAREAYQWLDENDDNLRLTAGERDAINDLKNQFVKDMLDDMKIKKSLLDKIEKLKTRVEFEL